MKLLKTITDKDFGSNIPAPDVYRERKAARVIVFDKDNNVALLHASRDNYYKIPGGGAEGEEDILEALNREMKEEIGCSVKNIKELGEIEEYRNVDSLHQISYCFVAEIDGEKGEPQFTQGEIEEGFKLVWLPYDQAIETIKNTKTRENANTGDLIRAKFMVMRDATFLKEAKK